jgi:NADPH-dependent 7-cyano-7-deazaguanine reductase QueF
MHGHDEHVHQRSFHHPLLKALITINHRSHGSITASDRSSRMSSISHMHHHRHEQCVRRIINALYHQWTPASAA